MLVNVKDKIMKLIKKTATTLYGSFEPKSVKLQNRNWAM